MLTYLIVAILAIVLAAAPYLVTRGELDRVFALLILVGTGTGGVGTVILLTTAMSRGRSLHEVSALALQTVGFWAVALGSAYAVWG